MASRLTPCYILHLDPATLNLHAIIMCFLVVKWRCSRVDCIWLRVQDSLVKFFTKILSKERIFFLFASLSKVILEEALMRVDF